MTDRAHMEGVYQTARKNGEVYYRSSLTYRRRHISLGSYCDALLAHLAYRTASRLIAEESCLTLDDYRPTSVLSFEKWVVLLNFRDNGIYLGTPIYIRPRFFYYYMSPSHVLKFDTDDLFYYASHKIMRRGSHYFVADYGMQVNIASRYGIKNYAVPGVDYDFLNGDPTDFRRENLCIRNTYHGVRAVMDRGVCRYSVRIHINGYYKVGVYDTITEAAIAYNKAIDLLKKAGVDKAYTPNYMEGISPDVYTDLYNSVQVSSRLLHFRKRCAD